MSETVKTGKSVFSAGRLFHILLSDRRRNCIRTAPW